MKLPKISFLIVLLTISQFINANISEIKPYQKWFGVGIMHQNTYEVTQRCIQMHFIPINNDIWTIVTVECDELSSNTIVNSMNMTTSELTENHENGVHQLEPLINYDSERHLIFYDSNREIFIILSQTPNDPIIITNYEMFNGWNLKTLVVELPPNDLYSPSKPITDAVCGNNLNGALDEQTTLLSRAILEMIQGEWHTVAIIQATSENVELNCEKKYFGPSSSDAVTMLTTLRHVPSDVIEDRTLVFPLSELYKIYESGARKFLSILNYDESKYMFLAENATYYKVLSRTTDAEISIKDDSIYADHWSLKFFSHENCVYNI